MNRWKYFLSIFSIGMINGTGYTLVAGGAYNLAADFDHESLMPMFQL